MATITDDLKARYRQGDISLRLVYINSAVFILTWLVRVVLTLFNQSANQWMNWLELPASFKQLALQPWSLLTYMFMHADIFHILFNMLWLYWFGKLYLNFFSARHLLGLYLFGGLCGGLLYMTAYNIFPYFSEAVPYAFMLGASASVLAISIATAYRAPNYTLQLLFFGTVRLKYLALIMVLTDLLFITSNNAGGHIAHLGGALAGLWFAASLNKGIDLTAWINKILDLVSGVFRPSAFRRKWKKPKMKVSYQSSREKDYDYNARKKAENDEIDRILDKIKKSGYGNLTDEEKKRLFDASRK